MVSCVENYLVRAELLVNGSSILFDEVDQVNYWHIELEQHSVVLANGLPAETYLDTGNRTFFTPDATLAHDADARDEHSECLPSITSGHVLAAIRAVTMDRAARIEAVALAEENEVMLALGDSLIHFDVDEDHCLLFKIRALTGDLRLVSGAYSPMWLDPASTDARHLGVSLTGLDVLDADGMARSIELSALQEDHGFYPLETDGSSEWRWTNGDAKLPLALFDGLAGALTVRVSYGRIEGRTRHVEQAIRFAAA